MTHPLDVIQCTRSGYYYNNVCLFADVGVRLNTYCHDDKRGYCETSVMSGLFQNMRDVSLIVALRFYKAHYRTYPDHTHFKRLICTPLT